MGVPAGPNLIDALESGENPVVDAWARRADAIPELAAFLGPGPSPAPNGVSGREMADRVTQVVVTAAQLQPDAFWDEFSTDRWTASGLVLVGLGEIDRPEVCARVVVASQERSELDHLGTFFSDFHRMDAVIALGKQTDPAAVPALIDALDDPEFLVRNHALKGLVGRVDGDTRAAVEAFRDRSDISAYEKELAGEVLAQGS